MIIGGLQKITLVDYPGQVAATVFTRGCNFRCAYCHNPELVVPAQYAKPISESDVLRFLQSRRHKLDAVCITGGEPTLHADLPQFVQKIKELGFLVKLDTNGSYPHRLYPLLQSGLIDYVAMDIKGAPHQYQTITQARVDLHQSLVEHISDSVAIIMNSGVDYEFRTTVAHPIHTEADFLEIGLNIIGAKRYFLQNYVQSKQVDTTIAYSALTEGELSQAKLVLERFIDYVGIR